MAIDDRASYSSGFIDSAYLNTVHRLEPNITPLDDDAAVGSIAISLKRIADTLEEIAQQLKFKESPSPLPHPHLSPAPPPEPAGRGRGQDNRGVGLAIGQGARLAEGRGRHTT